MSLTVIVTKVKRRKENHFIIISHKMVEEFIERTKNKQQSGWNFVAVRCLI